MRAWTVRVVEIATSSGLFHVRCGGGPEQPPAPGQFYLARRRSAASRRNGEDAEIPAQPFLRIPLYPYNTLSGGPQFWLDAAHPYAAPSASLREASPRDRAGLEPDDALDLLGPCGRGFDLPPRAAHLLLVAASPARLFSLLYFALDRGLAVAFLLTEDASLPELPPEVETLRGRGSLTAELAAWADVIALDVPDPAAFAGQARALRLSPPLGFVQALLTPLMPCGVGACQACWVETHPPHARKLACVEGPVFWW